MQNSGLDFYGNAWLAEDQWAFVEIDMPSMPGLSVLRMLMVIEMIFRFMFQLYDECIYDECIMCLLVVWKLYRFSEEDEAEVWYITRVESIAGILPARMEPTGMKGRSTEPQG